MFYVKLYKEEGDYISWQDLFLVTGRPRASRRTKAPACSRVKGGHFLGIQLGCFTSPFGYP